MFTPADLIKDGFSSEFSEEREFMDGLKSFDTEAEWKKVSIPDVKFVPIFALDMSAVIGGYEAAADSCSIAVTVAEPDGRTLCLRPWSYASLHTLCQDEARIYNKFETCGRHGEIAQRLNQDLEVLPQNKQFEFLIRGQKVSGAFGDFNHDWDQFTQVRVLKGKLKDMFGNHCFVSGSISHIETKAVYQLGKSIRDAGLFKNDEDRTEVAVLAPYREAWVKAGKDGDAFDEAIPYLEFCTGESGLTQIALIPKFSYMDKGTRIHALLGQPMKVNHRGSEAAVWGKYLDLLSNVAAQYQNGLREIARLSEKIIKNPYSCLTHCLKPFCSSIPLSEINMEADTFALIYPPTEEVSCSAYTIYETVNTLISRVADRVSPTKRLSNMEMAARMLSPGFSWSSMDVARPATLGGKKD